MIARRASSGSTLRVVMVSAEYAPVAKVGGLGEATAGLVSALRSAGVVVDVIIPDYDGQPLRDEVVEPIAVPGWAEPAFARHGVVDGIGAVTLMNVPGIKKEHPYVDPATGQGWPDNSHRFLAFSAAVAQLLALDPPDVVHINDWHTAGVLAFAEPALPSVLTIHNIAHQGWSNLGWLGSLGSRAAAFEHDGQVNALAGGIRLAGAVVAVSPSYANEILHTDTGCGLSDLLAAKGDSFLGIRNGISLDEWNPRSDQHLSVPFNTEDLAGKRVARERLLDETGLKNSSGPVIGMVSRLDTQKGIDIALSMVSLLNSLPARLVLHGSGSPSIARQAREVAGKYSSSLKVLEGYSDATAHRIMAGSDFVLIPSRFEPCGLTQMQAMTYGTIPVVTNVGGLRDTVIDLDRNSRQGNGFVAARADRASVTDALCRATYAWKNQDRRVGAQRRGMTTDWSWREPAASYIDVYREVIARHGR